MLADRIADWIAAAAHEANARGAVVGLSGGVDSAVTAALCKRVLKAIESQETAGIAPRIVVRVKEMIAASAHKRARARVFEVRDQCICATKRT
jgi:NH3-dependent NAD+ synthetase